MIKMVKYCKCGCGTEIAENRTWVNGHNRRKPKPEPKLCECGCGEYAKPGNRFIYKHNRRGTTISDEHKRRISESVMGDKNPAKRPESRKKISEALMGHEVSNETREKLSIINKGRKYSDDIKLKMSKASKLFYKNHPELCRNHSKLMNEYYSSFDDPGEIVVNHHIAYDFDHPELLTVRVTRRFHAMIHNPKGIPVTERGYSLID